jgi:exopolyphosphatase/guanosine-5'-triphosphate,3'-diphosphate pyrophosphatase
LKGYISEKSFSNGFRAFGVLADMVRKYGGADIYKAYATSAVRDASNGAEFVASLESEYGIPIEVISGDREAELIFRGVSSAVSFEKILEGGGNALILDIGGGSDEFIITDGKKILFEHSFPLGMARMREMFPFPEPVSVENAAHFTDFVNKSLSLLWEAVSGFRPNVLVGSSGTFDTFRDMIYGDKNKKDVSVGLPMENLYDLHEKLLRSTTGQRMKMRGMSGVRVDYIVLASLFTMIVMEHVKPAAVYQSSYSLKEGAMAEVYEKFLRDENTYN